MKVSFWQQFKLGTCVDRMINCLISEVNKTPDSPNGKDLGAPVDFEGYEKSAPAHGDLLFHSFLMKIQENPGQILR